MEPKNIDEATELLLWRALGDLSVETYLFTPMEYKELFGITCTVEEIEDALCRVEGREFILYSGIYKDEEIGMAVGAKLSSAFCYSDENDEEIIEFQDGGGMERIVNSHLEKYGESMSSCWC